MFNDPEEKKEKGKKDRRKRKRGPRKKRGDKADENEQRYSAESDTDANMDSSTQPVDEEEKKE